MIRFLIREAREEKKRAREALQYLSCPQAVHYLAGDEMTRPGRKRAAKWTKYNRAWK